MTSPSSVANVDDGGVAGFVDIDAIAARAKNGESKIGSIDFDVFAVTQSPDTEVKGALGMTNLHHVVIEIEEGETGFAGQSKGGGTDVQVRREHLYRSRVCRRW